MTTELSLNNRGLSEIPSLPDTIKIFYCCNNKISNLNNLPKSLHRLNCFMNELSEIPESLPNSLQFFSCGLNQISKIPESLRKCNSLVLFDCECNKIYKIENLPSSLKLFWFYGNPIDYVDSLKYSEVLFKLSWYQEIKRINKRIKKRNDKKLSIIKIQESLEKWLWKPINIDLTISINCVIGMGYTETL